VEKVGDFACTVEEDVEVAPRGVDDVLFGFEHHFVQAHRREPLPQRRAAVGQIAREALERGRAWRRGWVRSAHPEHVLTRERDHEIGGVEFVRRGLPAAVIRDRQAE
jgi:hypothetical protein